MAWSRTLGDLVSDVTDRADVSGYVNRHPPDTLRRRVIESYRALRDWMTSEGSRRWIAPKPIELDPAQAIPLDYGITYALVETGTGKSFEKPAEVEAMIAGVWRELDEGQVGDVYEYVQSTSNEPNMWVPLGYGGEPVSQTAGYETILIVPTKTTQYRIRVWGVWDVVITDADATTLYLDGPGFDWLIWDVVVKITTRDNDAQNTYQIAQIERAKIEEQIKKNIRTETKSVGQRRDVFRAPRRYKGYYTQW